MEASRVDHAPVELAPALERVPGASPPPRVAPPRPRVHPLAAALARLDACVELSAAARDLARNAKLCRERRCGDGFERIATPDLSACAEATATPPAASSPTQALHDAAVEVPELARRVIEVHDDTLRYYGELEYLTDDHARAETLAQRVRELERDLDELATALGEGRAIALAALVDATLSSAQPHAAEIAELVDAAAELADAFHHTKGPPFASPATQRDALVEFARATHAFALAVGDDPHFASAISAAVDLEDLARSVLEHHRGFHRSGSRLSSSRMRIPSEAFTLRDHLRLLESLVEAITPTPEELR